MGELTHQTANLLLASNPKNRTAALILAAGSSTRMGGKTSKLFLTLDGIPVLAHTLLAYQRSPLITEIIIAAREADVDAVVAICDTYHITKLTAVVIGGANRQESALRAFSVIGPDIRYVAIGDGARCLVTQTEIEMVCGEAYRKKAASAGIRMTGTVKRTTNSGAVLETLDRDTIWEAQTPQVFHIALYAAAQNRAATEGFVATDDNALVEHLGYRVQMVECRKDNIKLTTPDDLTLAESILRLRRSKQA